MADRLGIDPADVAAMPREALPALLAGLAALQTAVAARLAVALVPEREPVELSTNGDHWLTPDEAAVLAGVQRRVVYGWSRRTDWKPFTRRLSRKVLRVEEAGLRRWLERSR